MWTTASPTLRFAHMPTGEQNQKKRTFDVLSKPDKLIRYRQSERADGTFSRSDFAYDAEADRCLCPGGKELMTYRRAFAAPRDGVMTDGAIRYRASKFDCEALRAQTPVLSERFRPQDHPLNLRGRSRQGPSHRQNGGLRDLAPRAEEGRDAVCPPQAHPQARPTASARPERGEGRVPTGRHRPEFAEIGEARPASGAELRCVRRSGPYLHRRHPP